MLRRPFISTLFPYTTLFRSYKHSVPRFFVPEHGTMFTLALVRFPPTATKEINIVPCSGTKKRKSKDRKSGSAGMTRPISYAVFCLKKKKNHNANDALFADSA